MEYLIGFIISILVVAIGIFVFKRGKYYSSNILEPVGGGLFTIGGLGILMYSMTFMGSAWNRIEQRETINRISYIQKQLDAARERNEPLELAAIQQKVLEYNDDILYHKYYNKKDWFYDLFHLDEWDNVKLIK